MPTTIPLQFSLSGAKLEPGAKIYFFAAGTTTPKPTYANGGLTVTRSQPVQVSAAGIVPPIYFEVGAYRVRLVDAFGALIEELDPIQGAIVIPDAPAAQNGSGTILPTATMIHAYRDDVLPGWVRANGRTLGAAGSLASEYAAADAEALFVHLYNLDIALTVIGGRGASAAADFAAGKQITLPDARSCVLAGLSNMGGGASPRMPNWGVDLTNVVGRVFGSAETAISVDQMPQHAHVVTIGSAGTHKHTGATDVLGNHTHPVPLVSPIYAAAASGTGQAVVGSTQTTTDTSQASGAHGHTVALNDAGEHTHAATCSSEGEARPFNSTQPSMATTIYLKL